MLQYEELRIALLENEAPLKELAGAIGIDDIKKCADSFKDKDKEFYYWKAAYRANIADNRLRNKENRYPKSEGQSVLIIDCPF